MLSKEEYCMLVNGALQRNETVVIACSCTVRYSGRAESLLEQGDRLIVI